MHSKPPEFPFSMDNIPRVKRFACLSLKNGCIFLALLLILYSLVAIAQTTAMLALTPSGLFPESDQDMDGTLTSVMLIVVGLIHCFTMFLTTMMLIGVIRDKCYLMKPWIVWTSCQLLFGILLFIFWTTNDLINHNQTSLLVYMVYFMALTLRFYMLVLVTSHFKELEEETVNDRLNRLINDEPRYNAL
ncbi:uncharacterized protein LOC142977180 isoform X2 [Anticarsia gemmatalis]|uniref:uncharacterized protein LOC142977180 isoform X2 n=1 Tax=Anticarsia gemmatalis TaxID=129554 RepID=UPI003F75F679